MASLLEVTVTEVPAFARRMDYAPVSGEQPAGNWESRVIPSRPLRLALAGVLAVATLAVVCLVPNEQVGRVAFMATGVRAAAPKTAIGTSRVQPLTPPQAPARPVTQVQALPEKKEAPAAVEKLAKKAQVVASAAVIAAVANPEMAEARAWHPEAVGMDNNLMVMPIGIKIVFGLLTMWEIYRLVTKNKGPFYQQPRRDRAAMMMVKASEENDAAAKAVAKEEEEEEEDLPPWVLREREKKVAEARGDLPFGLYLLFSSMVAIAAVGSIFEFANKNPIFGVLPPESPLWAPILLTFSITGLPTAGWLFVKAISAANAAADAMDNMDGY